MESIEYIDGKKATFKTPKLEMLNAEEMQKELNKRKQNNGKPFLKNSWDWLSNKNNQKTIYDLTNLGLGIWSNAKNPQNYQPPKPQIQEKKDNTKIYLIGGGIFFSILLFYNFKK